MVLRVSALTSVAGSGLRQQCGEVRPGVDPLGQEVTVFVEEAFATEMAAESLVEALRFYVGGGTPMCRVWTPMAWSRVASCWSNCRPRPCR